ncbi:MAG: PhoH family protein [Acidobacteria bacterium]|nr:PhoH family protein [Acidobacteriota bacterium]
MPQVTLAEEGIDALFGARDQNLKRIERAFDVTLSARGNQASIDGAPEKAVVVEHLLKEFSVLMGRGFQVRPIDVDTAIRVLKETPDASLVEFFSEDGILSSVRRLVNPRSLAQQMYLKAMADSDMVISIGPAGTGKTYLAVAMAAAALRDKKIGRIVLTRPAVEAGEKLGYLPGDLTEKVNPYLRPLYDSLYDLIGFDKVTRMLDRGTIEVAPLAFMRGRTLNDAFIILDEAQNTTSEQMKMFLTRIGFDSKAVINGDITQVDLPSGTVSGLREANHILQDIDGIAFVRFTERDVVRHPLVQKVISAYQRYEDGRGGKPAGEETS